MRKKFKAIISLALAAAILPQSVCAATVFADENANEIIKISDSSGINFSLELIPSAEKNGSGEVILYLDSEKTEKDIYCYSADGGKNFKMLAGKGVRFRNLKNGSYSFCMKKKGSPEIRTDIYTVYLGKKKNSSPGFYVRSVPESFYKDGSFTAYLTSYEKGKEYEISYDKGKTWHAFTKKKCSVNSLKSGTYYVSVREKKKPETVSKTLKVTVSPPETKQKGYIKVGSVLQNPELPTGCESVSLTMLLCHLGFKTNKLEIADRYLPKGGYRKSDFNKVFVGDPHSVNSYGCFAGVIEKTAKKYLNEHDRKSKWKVKNITGCSPETLYAAIDRNEPVIVWASVNMERITRDAVIWEDEKTGKTVSWTAGEHCVLLTGYNKKKGLVYVNDPLCGKTSYDMKLFEKRFKQFDNNALIIERNK